MEPNVIVHQKDGVNNFDKAFGGTAWVSEDGIQYSDAIGKGVSCHPVTIDCAYLSDISPNSSEDGAGVIALPGAVPPAGDPAVLVTTASPSEAKAPPRASGTPAAHSRAADLAEIQALMHNELEDRIHATSKLTNFTGRFSYFVHVGHFDYFIGVFLCASAVILGVETDIMTKLDEDERPRIFRMFDILFFVVFSFELLVRLVIYRMFWFRMDGYQWNIFDIVVVSVTALDEISTALISGTEAHEAVKSIGFVRMLKFGRIVRVIRMVRLVPELKAMVYLIAASMSSFFWTLALMMIMMYLLAIYYTETAVIIIRADPASEEILKEKWGSIGTSVTSLFQAATGGDDWCNFVQSWEDSSATQSTKMMNTCIFMTYIAFAVLVMLNLVTGVFVESAERLIQQDRDADVIRQARKLFGALGGDGEHSLTEEEFYDHLQSHMLDEYLEAVDMRRDEAETIFQVLDVDNSGELSLDEFLLGTLRMKGFSKTVDCGIIKHMLREFRTECEKTMKAMSTQLDNLVVSNDVDRLKRFMPEVLV
eukprot:TRINITY_DN14076_c0_g2_i1.p1 TRINITY_DN14076_c0_g2~~TRINITY_DN14076_c0_g2_i1.p1  ORF type:complete len:563 (-),score=113.19 TRINITY_DN14076_c0_g2_i1:71-1678(-)